MPENNNAPVFRWTKNSTLMRERNSPGRPFLLVLWAKLELLDVVYAFGPLQLKDHGQSRSKEFFFKSEVEGAPKYEKSAASKLWTKGRPSNRRPGRSKTARPQGFFLGGYGLVSGK